MRSFERVSSPSEFWTAYTGTRLRIAVQPLAPVEDALAERTALAVQNALQFDAAAAAYQARRVALMRRERLFHEGLLLDLAPERLSDLLDRMPVRGLEHLEAVRGRGVLLVSLHYGLFSSLLCLWLVRGAFEGKLGHLSILFDSGSKTGVGLPLERVEALEAARLGHRQTTSLVDLATTPGAARELVGRLSAGGSALVFPDRSFVVASAGSSRTLRLTVGSADVAIPRGVGWLAERSRCAIVPVHIRPDGDSHAIVFGPPAEPEHNAIELVLQQLVDRTVIVEPGLWEGWIPLADACVTPGMPTIHTNRRELLNRA